MQIKQGYGHEGSWQERVCSGRYVDDLCLISKFYCYSCLARLPQFIYKDISFKEVGQEGVRLWLDILIDPITLQILPKTREITIPKPIGSRIDFIKGALLGALARVREFRIWKHKQRLAVINFVRDFAKRNQIQQNEMVEAFFKIQKFEPSDLLTCLKLAIKSMYEDPWSSSGSK